MIQLRRGNPPQILIDNGQVWLNRYLERRLANPTIKRPSSTQYRHPEILRALRAISHDKCFYCERLLEPEDTEVDHYIEIQPDHHHLAFEWTNLYLSCSGCNDKRSHAEIPVSDCVDPCGDEDPALHLTFTGPRMSYLSPQGEKTIEKYDLNRQDLRLARVERIHEFERTLRVIREKQIEEERNSLTEEEKRLLFKFAKEDEPFSLALKTYLQAQATFR